LQARAPASAYAPGRAPALLKVKRASDAEARVVAHTPGKGRLAALGAIGALQCQLKNGATCARPALRATCAVTRGALACAGLTGVGAAAAACEQQL
jgi:ATP-dependent DNA ligase